MCERRKIKNATSVLRQSASTWWESLSFSDKPHTWNDMKNLMREKFINPYVVINSNDEVHQLDQSLVIPPAMLTFCRTMYKRVLLNMRAKIMQMMLKSRKVGVLLMC